MKSSGHHYRTYILCTVNHEMPWYILVWVPGSDIYLCQEALYRSESCKRKLGKTLACGPPGMANQVHQAVIDATGIMPSPADPPGCCLLHFLHLFCLSFIIGMPNKSCILELRANQCLVCNFLCMPRCKSQIAPKKTQSLSCFSFFFLSSFPSFQCLFVGSLTLLVKASFFFFFFFFFFFLLLLLSVYWSIGRIITKVLCVLLW